MEYSFYLLTILCRFASPDVRFLSVYLLQECFHWQLTFTGGDFDRFCLASLKYLL